MNEYYFKLGNLYLKTLQFAKYYALCLQILILAYIIYSIYFN